MAYYPFATEIEAIYKLVGPDGTVAVFNDPFDPNYVGALVDVSGLDSPEIREAASDLTQSDGGVHGDFYFGRRPIVLSGRVFGHASVLERNTRLDRAKRASNALRADAVLSWKPSTRRENFVTNPRAVVDTSGWATTSTGVINSGGTLTRVTGVAPPVGTTGFQLVSNAATSQGAWTAFNAVAGRTYTFSIAARRTAGTDAAGIRISDASANNILVAGNPALPTGAWSAITATFVPLVSGVNSFNVRLNGADAATTYQFSDVMITESPIGTYVDGDTAGFYWQGATQASASGDFIEMQTWVRRQQPFRESGGWVKDFQIPLVSQYAQLFSAVQKTTAATANATPVSVENRGSVPSYPILRIAAPGAGTLANPTVTNSVTGLVFRTTGLTLAVGEIVEFDMLNHTGVFTAGARNGQAANQYINFATTAWPYLATGTQNMTLAGTSGGTLTVLWRDSWG